MGGEGSYIRSSPVRKLFYLTDYINHTCDTIYKSAANMMFDAVMSVLNIQNRGYIVYCHNLGRFDGPLLIEYLSDTNLILKPVYRNGIVYSLEVSLPIALLDQKQLDAQKGVRGGMSKLNLQNSLKIVFHDSYLILPASLEKLAKSFNCATLKTTFPHDFITLDTINYVGTVPEGFTMSGDDIV